MKVLYLVNDKAFSYDFCIVAVLEPFGSTILTCTINLHHVFIIVKRALRTPTIRDITIVIFYLHMDNLSLFFMRN